MAFPHVIVRYMAAVYSRETVAPPGDAQAPRYLVPDTGWESPHALSEQGLELLKSLVLARVRIDGFRRCIVLGPDEAIYIEIDGQAAEKSSPPTGGLRIGAIGSGSGSEGQA